MTTGRNNPNVPVEEHVRQIRYEFATELAQIKLLLRLVVAGLGLLILVVLLA